MKKKILLTTTSICMLMTTGMNAAAQSLPSIPSLPSAPQQQAMPMPSQPQMGGLYSAPQSNAPADLSGLPAPEMHQFTQKISDTGRGGIAPKGLPQAPASNDPYSLSSSSAPAVAPEDDMPAIVPDNYNQLVAAQASANGGTYNPEMLPSGSLIGGGSQGQQATPSPIPGGPTKIEKATPKLPRANEEMSLDKFDEFYGDLVGGIDERLGQLSGNEGKTGASALPNASVEKYSSDIDQMSSVQREIRLLQLKLKQAQLAKEVYDTIYPDNSEAYEERIAELEKAIVDQDVERRAEYAELEGEKFAIEQEYNELDMEFAQLQESSEISITALEGQVADLEGKVVSFEEQATQLMATVTEQKEQIAFLSKVVADYEAKENVLTAEDRKKKAASEAAEEEARIAAEKRIPLPGVFFVQGVGGRYIASFNMPSGVQVHGSLGSTLPNGMKITTLEARKVIVLADNGIHYELPFGNPFIPQQAAPMVTEEGQDGLSAAMANDSMIAELLRRAAGEQGNDGGNSNYNFNNSAMAQGSGSVNSLGGPLILGDTPPDGYARTPLPDDPLEAAIEAVSQGNAENTNLIGGMQPPASGSYSMPIAN